METKFDDPIPLPRGRQLVTLKDAGTYITKQAEHEAPEWQAAMEALILVAETGGRRRLRASATSSGYVAGHKCHSTTVVASLLNWANAVLKNKISRERSMPGLDAKRGTHSQQILKAGTISFDGSGIACLVRKMSGYGANLEVESQIGIPNSFDLVIDTEHSNSRRWCAS
jgi:hypothetical protein